MYRIIAHSVEFFDPDDLATPLLSKSLKKLRRIGSVADKTPSPIEQKQRNFLVSQ